MSSVNGIVTGGSASVTNGQSAAQSARLRQETAGFQALVDSMRNAKNDSTDGAAVARNSTDVPSAASASGRIVEAGRLNGDYVSSFAGTFTSEADKTARPSGAAANSAAATAGSAKTIDKTSTLYEKSLELESYFVKIMLSSMRSTLGGTSFNGEEKSYAQNMYEDMLYDELASSMTKNAGFGLADQIYLQLV